MKENNIKEGKRTIPKFYMSPIGFKRVHCECTTGHGRIEYKDGVVAYFGTRSTDEEEFTLFRNPCPVCHTHYFYFISGGPKANEKRLDSLMATYIKEI